LQDSFDAIFNEIRSQLDQKDEKREEILRMARKSIRLSSEAIRCLHRRETQEAEAKLIEIRQTLDWAQDLAADSALQSNLQIAYQEYAEAKLFHRFLENQPLESPEELSIPILSYLHALADLTGELRRHILDSVRKEATEETTNRAEKALSLMDSIYYQFMTLDYPNGLIPGVRRKSDMMRGIIERTRGDLTLAQSRIQFLKRWDVVKGAGKRPGDS
jgi:translin